MKHFSEFLQKIYEKFLNFIKTLKIKDWLCIILFIGVIYYSYQYKKYYNKFYSTPVKVDTMYQKTNKTGEVYDAKDTYKEVLNILKDNYDIVIIDIDFGDAKDTFARMTATLAGCDKKMLIGSMLPWKFKECIKKIERMGRFLHIKGLTMYTLTNGTKENEQLLQNYGVKVELTPIERNPFMISGENLHWFMKLLVPSYKGYNGEIR